MWPRDNQVGGLSLIKTCFSLILQMIFAYFKRRENKTYEKEKVGYISQLTIPGVSVEDIKVEIRDNRIYIYNMMEFGENGGYKNIRKLPYTLGIMDIPHDVNIKGITAKFEKNRLNIIMPYNELAGGFRRQIPIDKS